MNQTLQYELDWHTGIATDSRDGKVSKRYAETSTIRAQEKTYDARFMYRLSK